MTHKFKKINIDPPSERAGPPFDADSPFVYKASLYHEVAASAVAVFAGPIAPDPSTGISVFNPGNSGSQYQAGGGLTLSAFVRSEFPPDLRGQLLRSQAWVEQDDFLGPIVQTKLDIMTSRMALRCRPEEGAPLDRWIANLSSGKKTPAPDPLDPAELNKSYLETLTTEEQAELLKQIEFQRELNRIARVHDFSELAEQLLKDWLVCDSCILYWKLEPSKTGSDTAPTAAATSSDPWAKLRTLCALNPSDVRWENTLGGDRLYIMIPRAVQLRIQTALNLKEGELRNLALQALLDEGIEQKYIDAVKAKSPYVELKHEDGEYWIIKTRARKFYGLAAPSMRNIFPFLLIRKSFREGDLAASFMMKHFIQHVTAGESITQGPMTGSRNNWLTAKESDGLLDILTNISQSQRIATNHTVKVNYIYPPVEMFSEAKYTKAESSILMWAVIQRSMIGGAGSDDKSSQSTGFIGIKRVAAHITKCRELLDWMLGTFFDHPTISPMLKSRPDGCSVAVIFDDNVLKEARQLLEEVKFLVTSGALDMRSALRELNRDPDSVRLQKVYTIAENDENQIWEPINKMPGQDSAGDPAAAEADSAGRPANADTTKTAGTREQAPVKQATG